MSKVRIPLYKRLYEDIKSKIISNDYKKNSKLESVRVLAKRLGISTTTVEKAYNQLVVEGYVKSVPRSGYIVQSLHSDTTKAPFQHIKPIEYTYYENNNLIIKWYSDPLTAKYCFNFSDQSWIKLSEKYWLLFNVTSNSVASLITWLLVTI